MMSSNKKLLFDTHAFLAFFNREEGSETIKNMMDTIQAGNAEGFVATITLTELAYIYTRKADEVTARVRVMQIQHSKMNLIQLTPGNCGKGRYHKTTRNFCCGCYHCCFCLISRRISCHGRSTFFSHGSRGDRVPIIISGNYRGTYPNRHPRSLSELMKKPGIPARYGYLPNRLYRLCASSIVITLRMLTIPPGRTSKNAV